MTGRATAKTIAKPRLRFDRVALGMIQRLKSGLRDVVPDGKTLIVTCTAPIRQDSKTTKELETKIRALLVRNPARLDLNETIYENQIRARLVNGGKKSMPNVIGFVHNPDPGAAEVLLQVTEQVLGQLS